MAYGCCLVALPLVTPCSSRNKHPNVFHKRIPTSPLYTHVSFHQRILPATSHILSKHQYVKEAERLPSTKNEYVGYSECMSGSSRISSGHCPQKIATEHCTCIRSCPECIDHVPTANLACATIPIKEILLQAKAVY